jgi:hypothetical protein
LIDTGEFRCFLINRHLTDRINRHLSSLPLPVVYIVLITTKG